MTLRGCFGMKTGTKFAVGAGAVVAAGSVYAAKKFNDRERGRQMSSLPPLAEGRRNSQDMRVAEFAEMPAPVAQKLHDAGKKVFD